MKRLTILFGGGLLLALSALVQAPAQQPGPGAIPAAPGDDGPQVLAYGQMHEAFAQPTDAAASAITVTKQPPDPIPEMPPEQKPAGDDVQWFPGYWSWDQEKEDFIWISGVYRKVPAGQQFVPGYWNKDGDQWAWVSGFWSAAQKQELTYTPQPPKSLDNGPNLPPPSEHYTYSPGYWYYTPGGWYWHPGTWVAVQPAAVWVPPHWRWTPLGWVLVGGYWDYPLEDRGLVFAPVYFPRRYWAEPGWCYYPRTVITVDIVMDSCFIGPHHHHYYYGNYYGPRWHNAGFTAWVALGPRSHDPMLSYYRYQHRNNPQFFAGLKANYNGRVAGTIAAPAKVVTNKTFVVNNVTNVVNNTTINNVSVKGPVQVVSLQGKPAPKLPALATVTQAQMQKQVQAAQQMNAAVKSRQSLETNMVKTGGAATGSKALSLSVNQMKLPTTAAVKTTSKLPTPNMPGVTTKAQPQPGIKPVPHTPLLPNPGTGTGTKTNPGTGTGTKTNPGTGTGTKTNPGTGGTVLPKTGTGLPKLPGTTTTPKTPPPPPDHTDKKTSSASVSGKSVATNSRAATSKATDRHFSISRPSPAARPATPVASRKTTSSKSGNSSSQKSKKGHG